MKNLFTFLVLAGFLTFAGGILSHVHFLALIGGGSVLVGLTLNLVLIGVNLIKSKF